MGSLIIDKEKCNRDGICVAECPRSIIGMDSEKDFPTPAQDYDELCNKCGHCVAVCPAGALSLEWLKPEDCRNMTSDLVVTPEQAEQFLCGRRSIRAFKEKEVPRVLLEKLLEIACSAPSAKNEQPWHWTVVEDPAKVRGYAGMVIDAMRKMVSDDPEQAETMGITRLVTSWDEGYDRICRGAPHVIVAHGDKDWGFGTQDCTLAISHLDLYATSIGLGCCWGGYFYKTVNTYPPLFEALGIPADHSVFGAIMVGYPKFKYQRIPNRNLPRVTWK